MEAGCTRKVMRIMHQLASVVVYNCTALLNVCTFSIICEGGVEEDHCQNERLLKCMCC